MLLLCFFLPAKRCFCTYDCSLVLVQFFPWFYGTCASSCFQGFSEGTNIYSTPNGEWEVIDTFESGQVIEMDIVIVYYHWVREVALFG